MFNLAIIGCGAVIEELHLPAIRILMRQRAVTVVALVDRSKARMSGLKRYFPAAECFDDISEAFSTRRANIALVASPPTMHRAHVEVALSSGCHVLCEKPLATNSIHIGELAGLADHTERLLMVGLTRRFFPSLATAADMLRKGDLGGNIEFQYYEGGIYQWPIASDAPFRRELGGGGVLMDKGVHVLDSLLWLFGPLSVIKSEDDSLTGGVEGNCRLRLAGKEVQGLMQLSWDQPTANGLYIRGALGELKVNPNEFRWIEYRKTSGSWARRPSQCNWHSTSEAVSAKRMAPRVYEDCIYLQWVQFLRSCALGEPVPVDARAALIVAEQIEVAYRTASPLHQTWLSTQEQTADTERHWRNGAEK